MMKSIDSSTLNAILDSSTSPDRVGADLTRCLEKGTGIIASPKSESSLVDAQLEGCVCSRVGEGKFHLGSAAWW